MSIFKKFGRRTTILAILGSLIVAASAMAYLTDVFGPQSATSSGPGSGQNSVVQSAGGSPVLVGVGQAFNHGEVIKPDGVFHGINGYVNNPNTYPVTVTLSCSVADGALPTDWFACEFATGPTDMTPLASNVLNLDPGQTVQIIPAIAMINKPVNQNAAKGTTPQVTVTASQS